MRFDPCSTHDSFTLHSTHLCQLQPIISRVEMCGQDIPMTSCGLTMARNHLAPDDTQVVLKVFRGLQEAATEVIGEFANDLVTITVLAHLVWISPDSASTDVHVVEVSSILVHHQGELQRDYPGWYGG